MSKHQQERPELLANTFLEPMKFLPISPSCRELIDVWLQVSPVILDSIKPRPNIRQSEENRTQVAKVCHKDAKDITSECVETGAAFVCLKVEKPSLISKPVPDKALIIIAHGPLKPANGMFRGVDLAQGGSVIKSGDEPQVFDGGKRGAGLVSFCVSSTCSYPLLEKLRDHVRRIHLVPTFWVTLRLCFCEKSLAGISCR